MSIEIAEMGFVLGILTLGLVLVSQGLKTWQAKNKYMAEISRDEAYRKLAEESTVKQRQMANDLSDLRTRVANIEKMLRDI
jgi:hypothetical protein